MDVKVVNCLSCKDQHSVVVLELDRVQTDHEPTIGCVESQFSLRSSSEKTLSVGT